ncbi:hypothetical protein [Endozoicomonas acroporae]|uniref:hypothetical protein n=1 Tax=Endozoicomonas acroporae TaxID=1701104 RepID=UPI003D78DA77
MTTANNKIEQTEDIAAFDNLSLTEVVLTTSRILRMGSLGVFQDIYSVILERVSKTRVTVIEID